MYPSKSLFLSTRGAGSQPGGWLDIVDFSGMAVASCAHYAQGSATKFNTELTPFFSDQSACDEHEASSSASLWKNQVSFNIRNKINSYNMLYKSFLKIIYGYCLLLF